MLRGGSFDNNQNNAAAAYRNNNNPNNRNNNYGFRLVLGAHNPLNPQRAVKTVCSQKCRATTVFRLRRGQRDSAPKGTSFGRRLVWSARKMTATGQVVASGI